MAVFSSFSLILAKFPPQPFLASRCQPGGGGGEGGGGGGVQPAQPRLAAARNTPYGYGAQKVQKRAKNTSNLHRSSHSYARSIIVYVVLIIQMHTIPTQAPNMCVDGDR